MLYTPRSGGLATSRRRTTTTTPSTAQGPWNAQHHHDTTTAAASTQEEEDVSDVASEMSSVYDDDDDDDQRRSPPRFLQFVCHHCHQTTTTTRNNRNNNINNHNNMNNSNGTSTATTSTTTARHTSSNDTDHYFRQLSHSYDELFDATTTNITTTTNNESSSQPQPPQHHNNRTRASVMSPYVRGPMLWCSNTTTNSTLSFMVISDYISACQSYHRTPNAGVLTCLRYQTPSLRVTGPFHDADMLALAELFVRHSTQLACFLRRLDFARGSKEGKLHGKTGFTSHGALALSKILLLLFQQQEQQHSNHPRIQEILLQRNKIGPFGASAIFLACTQHHNHSLRKIVLRRCAIGEQGALALAEIISSNAFRCHQLQEIDLSANGIGFYGCKAIEDALRDNQQNMGQRTIVDLEGNLVFQEVMNGITHGLGMIMAIFAASLLSAKVRDMPIGHIWSCSVYSTSLIALYASSTLYHSFFSLQNTKYIFEVLDKCAIYILIAGSYTPFLRIVVADRKLWSVYLLTFIWICCMLGIAVEASYPTWRHRTLFSLAMYLFMGWSSLIALPEISTLLPEGCIHLMVLGGCAYTAGVPFFVRNNNLDHALWHLFVLAGSTFHWCGVYFYVARYVATTTTVAAGAIEEDTEDTTAMSTLYSFANETWTWAFPSY